MTKSLADELTKGVQGYDKKQYPGDVRVHTVVVVTAAAAAAAVAAAAAASVVVVEVVPGAVRPHGSNR